MPARRPYASRGVPRRSTTRRSGRRPATVLFVGLGLFAIFGVAWSVNLFASSARLSGAGQPEASAEFGAAQTDGSAPAQLADAPLPTPGAPAEATPATLTRQWNTTPVEGLFADPVLANRLDQAIAGVDGHVGVVVKDLGTGKGAVLNGDLELQSASLYKLPVLFSVFDLGLNMSEELTITDEALSYDAGTMELSAGETLSVAEALERMVTLSDNTSAVMLGARVGANRINANIGALGMVTTRYSLERMTTSANDMARFMELLADGQAVSPRASADMLHLLLRQRVNDRLPRLLPETIQIAHKTGNLPGVVNDVGILYGPNSTVVVAALVSDTSDETAAATGIAQLGLAADTYFENQAQVVDRPTVLPAPLRAIPPVWRESHPPTATPTPRSEVTLSPATPTLVASVGSTPTLVTAEAVHAGATATAVRATATPVPQPTATRAPPPPTPTSQPTKAPVVATPKPAPPTATAPPARR